MIDTGFAECGENSLVKERLPAKPAVRRHTIHLPASPTCAVSALPTTSSKENGRTPLRQQAFRVCLLLIKAKGIEFANNGLFKASSMIALQPPSSPHKMAGENFPRFRAAFASDSFPVPPAFSRERQRQAEGSSLERAPEDLVFLI